MIAGSAAALVFGAAGIAYASIPGPDGTIHGCYKTSGPAQGALITIDSSASCPSGYAALNWSQSGQVDTFYIVESDHQTTDAGQAGTVTVVCNSGDRATGGGGQIAIGSTPPTLAASSLVLMESDPFNSSGIATGWSVSYRNISTAGSDPEIWVAYADCVHQA